eukprot:TRINITY_DN1959_c0_g3_i1.p1 TRINITY_DN1959_c0_g3~~TRINITY_DN1959_c0_g3_i1.p1  ORF type:complete len:471 (+),score=132.36 TRINITY_DN1959_c0_g3_i1:52-1413(+)
MPNKILLMGTEGSGKSSLKKDLEFDGKVAFTSKYMTAEATIIETKIEEATPDAGAWVVVISSLKCLDKVKQALNEKETAPKTKLLVVNETTAGSSAAEDLSYHADVVNWAVTKQYEIIYRPHLPDDFTDFDKEATLKLGLLDPEPTGTARVYQALSCTPWAPLANMASLLYHPADVYPDDVLAALPIDEDVFSIDTKYYSARVTFTTSLYSSPPDDSHAVVAVFRSRAALDDIITTGLPSAEVGVLLGVGPDAETSRDAAWVWAMDNGYEVVMLGEIEQAGTQTPLADRGDEDDSFGRVVEALHATQWKLTESPKKIEKQAIKEPETAAPSAQPPADSTPVVKEATSRWHRRWVSARSDDASGCEIPPGWIFDNTTKKSRMLDSLAERTRSGDPTDVVDEDSDDEEDGDLGMHEYDKLMQEAMYLRQQGGSLDPDERHERAADVAMRMMGHRR